MVLRRLSRWTVDLLRSEARAGFLTIAMAVIATLWLNSSLGESYDAVIHAPLTIGPVEMDLHHWAADFLLAFFFFVVGIELRHELTSGALNSPRAALMPIAGALGGIVLPAGIYVAFNLESGAVSGWAIPAATDIAFALAVLALIAPKAPAPLRAFLLTLAVVDDLGAITIIAVAYTPELDLASLGGAALFLAVFWLLQGRRFAHPLLLGCLGLGTWYFVYSSGVHATIAGVALGLVLSPQSARGVGIAHRAMKFFHPFSSYVAVPLFVLVSAAVPLSVFTPDVISSPVFLGVLLGLLVGKPLGIISFVWMAERFLGGKRDPALSWRNIVLIGTVASIGFTVALLINDLAFEGTDNYSVGVAAIAVSAVLGAGLAFAVSRVPRL